MNRKLYLLELRTRLGSALVGFTVGMVCARVISDDARTWVILSAAFIGTMITPRVAERIEP